jgi:LysM repeat protein
VIQKVGAPVSLSDKLMDGMVQTQAPAAAVAVAQPAEGTPIKLASANLVKEQTTAVKKEMPKAADAKALSYQVKSGDTLWDIARRHKVTIAELQKWNNLGDKSAVKPGVTLTIRK